MAYFLRFTKNQNEKGLVSEDQVNKKMYSGLCAYDISAEVSSYLEDDYTLEDAFEIIAKKQAEFDNWHAHNSGGAYVIFSGSTIQYDRDNMMYTGDRAVIASLEEYCATGQLVQKSYGYACKSIELLNN